MSQGGGDRAGELRRDARRSAHPGGVPRQLQHRVHRRGDQRRRRAARRLGPRALPLPRAAPARWLVDLPFALPTAVAGIALATLYADSGWIGGLLAPLGVEIAFTPLGILVALVFIGLPFVVRTLQPVLADLAHDAEEAALTLSATRWQIFHRVILPALLPGVLTGMSLAFARGLGEYGSVIFIAGNMPGVSEIVPLLIVIKLEQFDYAGAAAIGVAMLLASFAVLLAINLSQHWLRRRHGI